MMNTFSQRNVVGDACTAIPTAPLHVTWYQFSISVAHV
jgi:hypothetical protein